MPIDERAAHRQPAGNVTSASPSPGPAPGLSRLVWAIAIPAMLTNVATALFGLADMWVIGRLGDASAQGAVELGAKFMLGLFIVFNFLKTGTIALTAQAAGRGNSAEQATTLTRALATSLAIGVILLALQPLAISAGLSILDARGAVADHARTYIGIRYWAGAAWLVNCVLIGWLIGQRRVKAVLAVEVAANVVHIGLDFLFVMGFGWGVAGVAIATVVSELLKLVALAVLVGMIPSARQALSIARDKATWEASALGKLFALNRDLFIRTLLLSAAMLIFARSGSQQGPVILAANGILFQLFILSTMLLDGFESASQVLCGEAKGSGNRTRFVATARLTLLWGGLTGVVVSMLYLWLGNAFAASFSTDPDVIRTTGEYTIWIVLLPIVGVASFVLDGIFVGASWTLAMLVTMFAAMTFYVGMLFVASPLSNTELWLAFTLLFVVRAVGQLAMMPRLIARDFSAS